MKTARALAFIAFLISISIWFIDWYLKLNGNPNCFVTDVCSSFTGALILLSYPLLFFGIPIMVICTALALVITIAGYLSGKERRLIIQSFLYLIPPAIVLGAVIARFI